MKCCIVYILSLYSLNLFFKDGWCQIFAEGLYTNRPLDKSMWSTPTTAFDGTIWYFSYTM